MKRIKETMIEALRKSGDILLDYFNRPMDAMLKESVKESQSSIVTEADYASDTVITGIIMNHFPDHNIISEETGYTNNHSDFTWIIDPLDGTSNFAAGVPWFGVLITVFKGNTPIMGGAFLPVFNTLYFAEKGNGAFINGEPMQRIRNRELKDSLFSFCLDYTDDTAFLNRGIEIFKYIVNGSRNIRSTNSLVDFLYVAEGKFGGLLNLFTRIWDIAGLGLIISEAGGEMRNADGTELNFILNDEVITRNFPVLAGNSNIVNLLTAEIKKVN